MTALQNDHLNAYVLSLPVNTEIAQVRGHDGYGFPKWVTDIDVDIDEGTTHAVVKNAESGTDVAFTAPTPRQRRHRSGSTVSGTTSYTHFDNAWHSTFNQTNALASGSTRFPRNIDLELGRGRVSDDLRSLEPKRWLSLDVMTSGQAALHMPTVLSVPSSH